ncbi:UDP-glycosyltransferase 87A2-like isoform X2 [Carica papaya]|uniref:UDP-glycosyltransferase 87A2-like isoform X2 n=1 Tax=Carica papaya TaxID=3649 RepID=UPI000B8C9337|nr:UDP-glycosyltransferase 87A2-like isoform X2 [Carica papaya]
MSQMIAGKLPTTDMDSVKSQPTTACHVVAIPYPGRGHINPMMNLCKSLASKSNSSILVTFVVTEEWLGFIGSESKPHGICLVSIPNVLPSELTRGSDMEGFLEAVHTKMEAPFERLLDRLEPLATLILADSFLSWVVAVGNRRNIPLASFWPMSASFFSVLQHHYLFEQHGHFLVDLSDQIFNSKLVVEDWKIGWRMKRIKGDEDNVVNRNEIKELVRKFMDIDDMEVKEMKRRVKQFQEKLRNAIHYTHELFENDIYSFLEKISQY